LSRIVRVRCGRGVLRPLDDAELREGEELDAIIFERISVGSERRQAYTSSWSTEMLLKSSWRRGGRCLRKLSSYRSGYVDTSLGNLSKVNCVRYFEPAV